MLSQMAQDMKAILQKSYYAQKLLDADIDKRTEIRLLMEKITPTLSDMPRGGSDDDKMCTALIRLEALDSKIENDRKKLDNIIMVNKILIGSLDSYKHREVLMKRYVDMEDWEIIANEMNCSERSIMLLHERALMALH